MDHGSFDRIARLLGSAGSRRGALGALLGAGALGVAEATAAKKKRRSGKKGKGGVSAQLVCPPPVNGVNRSNCDYEGDDFSGELIHSSIYKNTIFRNAELVGTDLSSSNMRAANFRGANLCGADLSSSTLRDADFRGFGLPGRETNLTLADLHSSACAGLQTNGNTFICGTTWCDGTIRNDDCPGGPDSDFCCTPCGDDERCIDNECVVTCDLEDTCQALPTCGDGPTCFSVPSGSGPCDCVNQGTLICAEFALCVAGACGEGFTCYQGCCSQPRCWPTCGAAAATRSAGPSSAVGGDRVQPD